MKNLFKILIISLFTIKAFAQSVTIDPANGPAIIEAKSTTQGFLLPRMTLAQRNAIVNPTGGLEIYQTDGVAGVYYYDNTANWWTIVGNQSFPSSFSTTGNDIYTTNTGKVGIGTPTPADKLTIKTSSPNFGFTHTDGTVSIGSFLNGTSGEFGTRSNHPLGFFSNGIEGITLLQNGKLGIGTTAPLSDIHIKQSNEAYPIVLGGLRLERQTTTDNWVIGVDYGNDLNFNFNGVGKGYIKDTDGTYVPTSDLRLKKDILPIGAVLPLVLEFEAKTYHYKDNDANSPLSYGFIAQEIEKLFPDFVSSNGSDGMKALAYQNIGVVAVKAIQEQQHIIDALLKRLETLENKK